MAILYSELFSIQSFRLADFKLINERVQKGLDVIDSIHSLYKSSVNLRDDGQWLTRVKIKSR